ncbi:MAG: sulfotransferase domain-containing protein [Deltaproteobacteria bacterium]|nr:sulfotransferase domain-containing protein [Deltaproteobacteria bacterium]MBW2152307.1 sulfotransferase domain-containing protein [Deltaproteobacteria bacterium]
MDNKRQIISFVLNTGGSGSHFIHKLISSHRSVETNIDPQNRDVLTKFCKNINDGNELTKKDIQTIDLKLRPNKKKVMWFVAPHSYSSVLPARDWNENNLACMLEVFKQYKQKSDYNIKVAFLIRNPFDQAASIIRRFGYKVNIKEVSYRIISYYDFINKMMENFNNEDILLIKYEELCNNTDRVLDLIWKWLEIDGASISLKPYCAIERKTAYKYPACFFIYPDHFLKYISVKYGYSMKLPEHISMINRLDEIKIRSINVARKIKYFIKKPDDSYIFT